VPLDLPGHGGTTPPETDRVESLAEAVGARIAGEVGRTYALLGHSLGGMVAMCVANGAGGAPRPARLILADTTARPARGVRAGLQLRAISVAALLLGHRRATEHALEAMKIGQVGFDATLRTSMLDAPAWPLHRMLRAVRRFDGRGILGDLTMPTLLLMAGANPATAGEGERMAGLIRDARVETLPGSGHMQMRDDPEGFARAVSGFLRPDMTETASGRGAG
jgi:pimeloyl-ACP methyl ester carboxylesterase